MQNKKTKHNKARKFQNNSTFKSDFLVYFELLKGDKFDYSISKILILDFYYFYYFSS
jgi:hypothetical protein